MLSPKHFSNLCLTFCFLKKGSLLLIVIARYCLLLLVIACYCLLLLVIARYCSLLLVIARYCLLLLVISCYFSVIAVLLLVIARYCKTGFYDYWEIYSGKQKSFRKTILDMIV
jgi:hypothetical protein